MLMAICEWAHASVMSVPVTVDVLLLHTYTPVSGKK